MEPTWGKTEREDTKLVEAASPAEAKELPVLRMDGDVEVGVPQVPLWMPPSPQREWHGVHPEASPCGYGGCPGAPR
jgi:hypothetical protein